MSFAYTERITPIIIGMIEEGFGLKQIAKLCNVSVTFVKTVRDNYDNFYINLYEGKR